MLLFASFRTGPFDAGISRQLDINSGVYSKLENQQRSMHLAKDILALARHRCQTTSSHPG